MTTETEMQELAEKGKKEFGGRSYLAAAQTFQAAARGYTDLGNDLLSAEMKNNQSVALLKAGKMQEALDVLNGTESIFAGAKDKKRQGMALGNQAAALEELKRLDEALDCYERSAELFREADEKDLLSTVQKSAAGVKLKLGKVTESGFKMIGALEAKEKPSLWERILKFFLRLGM